VAGTLQNQRLKKQGAGFMRRIDVDQKRSLRSIHALFEAFLPEKPHGYCANAS
jgi:hypothetical protein